MKRLFLFAFVCAATLSLTGCVGGLELFNFGTTKPDPKHAGVGRYQMVSQPGGPVLKMDTTTGDVWRLENGQWVK